MLGADPGDDERALRAAYRRRARQTHPDQGGSAEEFHQVQKAWEILGDADSRAQYDQRQRQSSSTFSPDDASSGVYSPGTFTNSARADTASPRKSSSPRRSPQADQPVQYVPELSTSEPLSLRLTSQKVHGAPAAKGLFGSSRTQRVQQRSIELLTQHVLEQLPAARLFNDVHLQPIATDKKGRRRPPRQAARADHVVVCGHSLVVVSAAETGSAAAAWDGHTLRSAGRATQLPDVTAAARALRMVLEPALMESGAPQLDISGQIMLLAPDSLLSPVVESRGVGRNTDQPLAAGRALKHITETLAAHSTANLVDRHLLAAVRAQLHTPEET